MRIIRLGIHGPFRCFPLVIGGRFHRILLCSVDLRRVHQWEKRLRLHRRGSRNPGRLQQRRCHLRQSHPLLNSLSTEPLRRKLQQQRNMDRLVVQKHSVPLFPMLAKSFPMVGGDGDDRVLIQAVLPQYLDKTADNRVRVGNLAVVRLGGIVGFEGLRRVIRIVGIVEMQPDKKRPLLMTAQPTQRAIRNILRAPLDAFVAVFSRLALVKVRVVYVKAALETWSRRSWIENIGTEERRSVIAVLMKKVRQVREILAERCAQILDMTELRIGPRQQSGMRRRGQRNLRVGSREHHALLGECIEVGRQAALGAEKAHAIGPRCVECDQDDVGELDSRRDWLLGGFRESSSAHKVRQEQNNKKPANKLHRGWEKV